MATPEESIDDFSDDRFTHLHEDRFRYGQNPTPIESERLTLRDAVDSVMALAGFVALGVGILVAGFLWEAFKARWGF